MSLEHHALEHHAAAAPHDLPTAEQLVAAVRGWLADDLSPQLTGASRFHARVAANMLAIVERELAVGPAHAVAHRARLDVLGVADDAELAAAIRDGSLDDRMDEVAASIRASLVDELSVSHPGYVDQPVI